MDEFIAWGEEESFEFDPENLDDFSLDVADLRDEEGVVYPALLLSHVLFMDCLKVLQSAKRTSYREVDTWIELQDGTGFTHVGTLQLDSATLLVLRHLAIGATLYYSDKEFEILNLNDPKVIERFI